MQKTLITKEKRQEDLFKVLKRLDEVSKTMLRMETEINCIWKDTVKEMSISSKDVLLMKFEQSFKNAENFEMFKKWLEENL